MLATPRLELEPTWPRLELEAPAGQRFSQKDASLKNRENGTTWLRKGDVQRLAPAAFCIREHYD